MHYITVERQINIFVLNESVFNKILEDLPFITKAINGDKSPSTYRRIRRFKKMGLVTISKDNVRLSTDPTILVTYELKDSAIVIRDFAIIYTASNRVHTVSSICSGLCEKCMKLTECSNTLKNMLSSIGVYNARGVTPMEVAKYLVEYCLGRIRFAKIQTIIGNNHSNSNRNSENCIFLKKR